MRSLPSSSDIRSVTTLFGRNFAFGAAEDVHLLHPRLRVLVGDDRRRARELDVAADVIGVRVRVDDRRHRLVRDGLDRRRGWTVPSQAAWCRPARPRRRASAPACCRRRREDVENVADVQRLHPDDPVALRLTVICTPAKPATGCRQSTAAPAAIPSRGTRSDPRRGIIVRTRPGVGPRRHCERVVPINGPESTEAFSHAPSAASEAQMISSSLRA